MKKKVLFFIGDLSGGGAEKVLTDIVRNIDSTKYDITVMTMKDEGVYIEEVKKHARYRTCFKTLIPGRHLTKKAFNIIRLKIREYICKLPMKYFYRIVIREKYDIEIAFLEDISTKIIANSANKSSKKYSWVHTDLENNNWSIKFFENFEEQKNIYKRFDKIICVSESAKTAFERKFDIHENVFVQYNPIDENSIILKANEKIDDIAINNKFKIVTVGRLSRQKGYDRLLEVFKRLLDDGFDIELWILGEGVERKEIQEFVKENTMSGNVYIIGFKTNPYKYMKKCNLFVCSSRYEGFSLAVAEAMILGLPVVSTKCTGPEELLEQGEYGLLTENNLVSLYEGLRKLLSEEESYYHFKNKSIERGHIFNLNKTMENIEILFDN